MQWIPCGEGFIEADVIRWREGIWERRGPKQGRAIKVGDREVIAEVLSGPDEEGWVMLLVRNCTLLPGKDKYLPRTGQLAAGEEIRRKDTTILRAKVDRLHWSEEGVRARLIGSRFMRPHPVSSVTKRKKKDTRES